MNVSVFYATILAIVAFIVGQPLIALLIILLGLL